MKRLEKRDTSFEKLVQVYLERKPDSVDSANIGTSSELEVRFHVLKDSDGLQKRPLSRNDYESVVAELYSAGFEPLQGDIRGLQLMRIYAEGLQDTRVELCGMDTIQDYCQTNSLQSLLDSSKHSMSTSMQTKKLGGSSEEAVKVRMTKKVSPKDSFGQPIPYVDVRDYRFRVSYKMETNQTLQSAASLQEGNVSKSLGDWKDRKKTFRFMNRVRFAHKELPIFADMTIVKMSKQPVYTMQESGVISMLPSYEIELEVDNSRCGLDSPFSKPDALLGAMRKTIRIVLQGLQKSPYPISYTEQDSVLREYLLLVNRGKKWEEIYGEAESRSRGKKEIDWSRYFAGPSSKTLQWQNMRPPSNDDNNAITIQRHYTVTDKADGERKLLFISGSGKVYAIDINMNISFTGSTVEDKNLRMTLIDGEHIRVDKSGQFINLFACFDVYFIQGKSCQCLPFVKIPGEEEIADDRYRLYHLESLCSQLLITNSDYHVVNTECYLKIRCKQFYVEGIGFTSTSTHSLLPVANIFEGCRKLLQGGIEFDYETDGLIFTPSHPGVLNCKEGDIVLKRAWDESFKWKPPKYNTVDFMVRNVKDKGGKDQILYEKEGMETVPYKMTSLWCGYNESRDLKNYYCDYALNDLLPERGPESYKMKPMRFIPSAEPYDPEAYFCKMPLVLQAAGKYAMKIEGSDETFDENTIVEFRYDLEEPDHFKRWKPIRIRYDKTEQLRQFHNNFGNAYEVANSNWYSIHHPITEAMLCGDDPIPNDEDADDTYYNRGEVQGIEDKTRALRNFHNKYIKTKLIACAAALQPPSVTNSRTGIVLLDIAVGLAGDLHKWVDSGVRFAVGIDSSRKNLTSPFDGACKRYMEWRVRNKYKPFRSVFLHGDGGRRITTGECFGDDGNAKKIMDCLLGKTKDVDYKLVQRNFGVCKGGFHIVSCQFAMHYFFQNKKTLNEFIRNVSENTTEGGYFIGTCYDGKAVFSELQKTGLPIMSTYPHPETGEPVQMFRIEKRYTQDVFEDDITSLGYRIDVYQETINKVFPEYLVNFAYFTRLMEEYGFNWVDNATTNEYGLGNATGMFRDLFETMPTGSEARRLYGEAANMSDAEKKVSFLNRYFVFRKNRNAAVDIVFNKQMAIEVAEIPATPSNVVTNDVEQADSVMTPNEEAAETVVATPEIKKTKRTYKPRKTKAQKEAEEEEAKRLKDAET